MSNFVICIRKHMIIRDQINGFEMGGACGMRQNEAKYFLSFGEKNLKKKVPASKTYV